MNWLEKYLEYTSSHEAPEIFHRWSALAGIAGVVNRKAWLIRKSKSTGLRFIQYPGQLMVVLVAGSGECRKSTAVGFIEDLLRRSETVDLYSGKITPERLLAKLGALKNGAILTVVCDELSYFFSKAKYAESMIENILKLTAAKETDEYETQERQRVLRNACFTGLFATIPQSLGESIPAVAHGKGFMVRFIWVFADQPRRSDPMFDDDDEEGDAGVRHNSPLGIELVQGLKAISLLKGRVRVAVEARKWFQAWYMTYREQPDSKGEGWPARRHEHLVRTAMVLGIAKRSELTITTEDLLEADQMLIEIETGFPKAFAYIGRHTAAEGTKRIIELLNRNGVTELSTGEIIKRLIHYFRDAKELRTALDTLRQAGTIMPKVINAGHPENTIWVLKATR